MNAMPKLLILLSVGAAVGIAALLLPRFRKKTEVVTADASDVEKLFLAASDASQIAEFKRLYIKTSRFGVVDGRGRSVFSVAVSSLNSAAFRFVLSVSVTPDQRVALFEAADADGAAAVEALVNSATEANAGQCVAALKDLLASDTILCLYLARLRNPVSGRTALMAAVDQCRAVQNALDIVKLLVKLQADLDAQDLDGSSALMLACASPNTRDVALFLLQSTACDVKSFDTASRSALYFAAQQGFLDCVKLILTKRLPPPLKSPPSLSSLNSLKKRPASSATSSLDRASTRDANKVPAVDSLFVPDDELGMTPFLAAIRGGHLDVAQVLLESMMDSQSKLEQSGSSPAAEFSGVKLSAFYGVSCLHLAVISGSLSIVKWVIGKRLCVDFSLVDESGITPFHLAANLHHADILSFFFAQSSSLKASASTNSLQTPLHLACTPTKLVPRSVRNSSSLSRLETIRILMKQLEASSVLSMRDEYGQTPLAYYLENPGKDEEGHLNILKMLTPPPGQATITVPKEITLTEDKTLYDVAMLFERIAQEKGEGRGGGGVAVILGERALPPRTDNASYAAGVVSYNDAFENPTEFYHTLSKAYTPIATTKFSTPLAHHILLKFESLHILTKTYSTTVDGSILGLSLIPAPIEVYGNLLTPAPRCLRCGTPIKQEPTGENTEFWEKTLPAHLKTLTSRRRKTSVIPCPRAGCVHGAVSPHVFYSGQSLDTWVSRVHKGWGALMKGVETWECLVIIGATRAEDEFVRKVLGRIGKDCVVLRIDTKVDGESNGRGVEVVVGNEEGGVQEGVQRLCDVTGWLF